MDQSVYLLVDILVTGAILFLVLGTNLKRDKKLKDPAKGPGRDALDALRKKVDNIAGMEDSLASRQTKLKEIIEGLDEALNDMRRAHMAAVRSAPSEDSPYVIARRLIKRGEPLEMVMKRCRLTRGEANVLATMAAMTQ